MSTFAIVVFELFVVFFLIILGTGAYYAYKALVAFANPTVIKPKKQLQIEQPKPKMDRLFLPGRAFDGYDLEYIQQWENGREMQLLSAGTLQQSPEEILAYYKTFQVHPQDAWTI